LNTQEVGFKNKHILDYSTEVIQRIQKTVALITSQQKMEKRRVPLTEIFTEKVIVTLNEYVEKKRSIGMIKTRSFIEDVLKIPVDNSELSCSGSSMETDSMEMSPMLRKTITFASSGTSESSFD